MTDPALTVQDPQVLVIDDDTRLRDLLRRYLLDHGFTVVAAASAQDARAHLQALVFDVLVVDVMMPDESGLDFVRWLRQSSGRAALPVLMLTARGETEDRIDGLEAGADDYLTKPFEPRELVLRLRSLLRRATPPSRPEPVAVVAGPMVSADDGSLILGEARFDLRRCQLSRHGQPIHLTTAEAQLLTLLAQHPHQPFSRDELAEALGTSSNPRTVDVQVTRLRKKLENDPRQPRYLQTLRGTGYILRPE